jgi:hypothetical protein
MKRETQIRIAEDNGLIYQGAGEDGELQFMGDKVSWSNYTRDCDTYEAENPYEEEDEDWKKNLDRESLEELKNESDSETIKDEPSEDYPLGGMLEPYDIARDAELIDN